MTPENQQLLMDGVEQLGLRVVPEQLAALASYHDALQETTAGGLNLTGLRDERESVVRNLIDSLAGWTHIGDPEKIEDEGLTMVEVGSGAGLPGIPLAIVLPFPRVVLVDSKEKKCQFLRDVAEPLNELIAPRRIEVVRDDANRMRIPQRFDRLVCRAFGPLGDIMRLCDRFLAHDGRGVAYKGRRERILQEMASFNIAQRNRCEIEEVHVPFLEEGVQRHVVRIKPHSKTPRTDEHRELPPSASHGEDGPR